MGVHLHGLSSQGVDDLLGVEVLGAVSVFLKELSRTVAEQLVVSNLQFKRPIVPLVVELDIVWVDEGEFLVYGITSVAHSPA